ncbi:MAG: extensin family protein [Janthinobacterium lividum]
MLAAVRLLTVLVLAGFAIFIVRDHATRYPQDLPWTPLDLTAPIGWSTQTKLLALRGNPARCMALLEAADVRATPVPDEGHGTCRLSDPVRVTAIGLPLEPGGLVISCPLAAALYVWTTQMVRPAVRARLGTNATALTDLGSYNCRRIAGSDRTSEHSTANAIDISGIRIARGTTVALTRDWKAPGPRAELLRDLHSGACRLFGTVLSPDYNAAHHDHFHLDMASWRACH